jgi:hypothetical protein
MILFSEKTVFYVFFVSLILIKMIFAVFVLKEF